MRDFRDAKAMAQTLREALKVKSISVSHSESLELVARTLGFHDWNVLSAAIQEPTRSIQAAKFGPDVVSFQRRNLIGSADAGTSCSFRN